MSITSTSYAAGIAGGGTFAYGFFTGSAVDAVTGKPISYPGHVPINLAGLPVNPATDDSVQAGNALLAQIKAALLAQVDLATSVWTDGTSFYVRRETLGPGAAAPTVAFENPDGTTATVTAAGLKPVASDNALTVLSTPFDAIAAGTGFAINDVLSRVVVLNKAVTPPTASAAIWLNLTQGTTIAAPAAAAIAEQSRDLVIAASALPAGAARDATLSSIAALLAGTLTTAPQVGGSPISAGNRLPVDLARGPTNAAGAIPVTLATDGIVATAYGAPTDAATTDVGATGAVFTFSALFKGMVANLFAMRGAAGTPADAAATAASTSGSAIAWLRGMLVALGAPAQSADVQAVTAKLGTVLSSALSLGGSLVSTANRLPVDLARGPTNAAGAIPVTLATNDPSALAIGTTADAAATSASTSGSMIAWLRGLLVAQAAPVLAAGAATEATLAGVKAALLAQVDFATSVWTDGTNYYVRRETLNEATGAFSVAFTNPDGSAFTGSASGLKPVASDNALTVLPTQFDAVAAGTGFAANDVLARVVVLNKAVSPPAASSALWLNLTQGTTLASAPAAAAIVEQTKDLLIAASALPAGAAKDTSLASILAALGGVLNSALSLGGTAVSAGNRLPVDLARGPSALAGAIPVTLATNDPSALAIGTTADAAATSASTSGSIISWLRGIYLATIAPLPAGSAVIGGVNQAGTWSVGATLVDGADATQGAKADAAATPASTSGSVIAWLRGIYAAAIAPLPSGTNTIGGVNQAGTWSVGATLVDGANATQGAKADAAATSASTSGSVIAWLRGIFAAVTVPVTPRTYADKSGTTSSTAGSFTTAVAANAARQGVRIVNIASSGTLYVWDKTSGTPSTTNSVPLSPGGIYLIDRAVSGAAIQIAGSAASMAFEGMEAT